MLTVKITNAALIIIRKKYKFSYKITEELKYQKFIKFSKAEEPYKMLTSSILVDTRLLLKCHLFE